MAVIDSVKVFGQRDTRAPGVSIREQISSRSSTGIRIGTTAFFGKLKRGPMGVPIPIGNQAQYNQIFGNPFDPTWHLYDDPTHGSMPDAIDGFYNASQDTSILWVVRNELNGEAKSSEQVFYSRSFPDYPVLKITASSEGRWGGERQPVFRETVLSIDKNTFVINRPNVGTNELVGAKLKFRNRREYFGEEYTITANTKSDEDDLVTITLKAGIDLEALGVDTVEALTGTISYDPWVRLPGTWSYQRKRELTGTLDLDYGSNLSALTTEIGTVKVPKGQVTIKGTGTNFTNELDRGDQIWIGEEYRIVNYVWSDTLITISSAFEFAQGNAVTAETLNQWIDGTIDELTEDLLTDIHPGHINIERRQFNWDYFSVRYYDNGNNVWRYSYLCRNYGQGKRLHMRDSQIFPVEFTGVTLYYLNYWAEATGIDETEYSTQEDYLIDPRRATRVVSVRELDMASTPPRIRVWSNFAGEFTDEEIIKLATTAEIELEAPLNSGLSIRFGNGNRFPDTHFSMTVFLQGQQVMYVPDASLDPKDPYFVEQTINDANIVYQDDGVSVYRWIKAESLLNEEYTTQDEKDYRPANASAEILVVNESNNTVYYKDSSDSKYLPQAAKIYLDPLDPRRFARVIGNISPSAYFEVDPDDDEALYYTIRTDATGRIVYRMHHELDFRNYYEAGDYFFDIVSGEYREITKVTHDALTLISPLPAPLGNHSPHFVLGKFQLNSVDLEKVIERVGKRVFFEFSTDLEGGYDGDDVNVPVSFYTRYFDLSANILEKAALGKNHGLIRIAVPGVYEPAVQLAALEYAASHAYEFRVEIPPYITDAIAAENFINSEIGHSEFAVASFPSYGEIRDPRDGSGRFIPLTGDIMGLESMRAIAAGGYHGVAAGFAGTLSRVAKLPVYLDPYDDEGVLNQRGIQPITRKSGLVVIFGSRTLSNNNVYIQSSVRRNQSSYVRTFAESPQLYSMLFRTDTPGWDQEVMMYLRRFFENEQRKGAITQRLSFGQSVKISRGTKDGGSIVSSASEEDIYVEMKNGTVYLNVSYRPANMVEKIVITMTPYEVTSTLAS